MINSKVCYLIIVINIMLSYVNAQTVTTVVPSVINVTHVSGGLLYIYGRNLGKDASQIRVKIVDVHSVELSSSNSIDCMNVFVVIQEELFTCSIMDFGETEGLKRIVVEVDGVSNDKDDVNIAFSHHNALILDTLIYNLEESIVVISGLNFGNNVSLVSVSLDGFDYPVISVNNSVIVCALLHNYQIPTEKAFAVVVIDGSSFAKNVTVDLASSSQIGIGVNLSSNRAEVLEINNKKILFVIVIAVGVVSILAIIISLIFIRRRQLKNLNDNERNYHSFEGVGEQQHSKFANVDKIKFEGVTIAERKKAELGLENSMNKTQEDITSQASSTSALSSSSISPLSSSSSSTPPMMSSPTAPLITSSTASRTPPPPPVSSSFLEAKFVSANLGDSLPPFQIRRNSLDFSNSSGLQNISTTDSQYRRASLPKKNVGGGGVDRLTRKMSLPLSALRRSSLAFSSLINLPIRAKNEVVDEQQSVPSENNNTIVKSDSMEEINLNDDVISDPIPSAIISSSSLPFSFSKIRRASLVVSEFFTPPTIASFPKVKKQIPPLSLDGDSVTASLPPLTTTATLKKSKKNEKEGTCIMASSVPSSRIINREKDSYFAKQNVLDSPDLYS